MARTWLSIDVELVGGMHAHDLWPRPGRVLLARPGMTFRALADAINDAFARWELSHLHAFTLADGTRIALKTPYDELDDDALDDTRATLSRLSLGEQFTFEFDFGDSWMHLCTVAASKVDPLEVYGEVPDRPVPYFGWGVIPDQHGRRWADDDGSSPVPPQPDPPLSDLPNLHHTWGDRAYPAVRGSAGADPAGAGTAGTGTAGTGTAGADPAGAETDTLDGHGLAGGDGHGTVIAGPWGRAPGHLGTDADTDSDADGDGDSGAVTGRTPADAPLAWTPADAKDLRSAVYRRDHATVIDLLFPRDRLAVAHQAAPMLLYAVQERVHRAMQIAVMLTDELTERDWPGDAELVTEIERALVPPGSPDLRPTPVQLDELLVHLDGPGDPEGD